MRKLTFTKMHGIGNDYVYVDCFSQQVANPEQLSVRVSDRHKGIGSDGLVLIMPSSIADFRMRIFNADGSEAKMCGNASRCIGKYVYEHGLTNKTTLTLETLSGIKTLQLQVNNHEVASVRVNMGKGNTCGNLVQAGTDYLLVDVGNPHAVCFVDNVAGSDIAAIGQLVEKSVEGGVNVEFVEIINRKELKMRVWERGSGETMACGTGACAAVVAAIHEGYTDSRVVVHLTGGDLSIEQTEEGSIFMTGTATEVFTGEILV